MPPLILDRFTGMVPRLPADELAKENALIAENCDFSAAQLQSLPGDFKLKTLGVAAKSLWSEDGLKFYAWPDDVDAIVSPLQSGAGADRLYYTSGTDFRVTQRSLATPQANPPATSYRVGVPRPSVAPSVTVVHPALPAAQPATVDALPADTYQSRLDSANAAAAALVQANTQIDKETRAYTYTYANIYNEEGPPSDAVVVEVWAVTYNGVTTYSTVKVQVTFDGTGPYVPISGARVYRTANTGTSSDYYYALTIPLATGSAQVTDAVKSAALNETIPSLDAYPPDPTLRGLINVGNGILAAWKGNEIWFSEPYRPWAWPPKYMKTFRWPVVGAIAYGAGALVTTRGRPSIISGASPDGMVETPLAVPQAGVSKWAMIEMGGMIAYASNDGIVVMRGEQPDMGLSAKYFTRDSWRDRVGAGLDSMQFALYDGNLVVFSRTNAFPAFMLEIAEAGASMTNLPNLVAQTALVLVTSDQMYIINGTELRQFAGGDDLALRWKSGDMVLPAPAMLGVAQVECIGNFTIRFYQNGVLGYTKQVTTGTTVFRLPDRPIPGHNGLRPSDRWQFEISGTGTFKRLRAADSPRALKGV